MTGKNIKDYQFKIHYLETQIVDNCNLNCDICTHFSHLIKNDIFVDVEQYIKDINQLADNLYIQRIKILGGEPLLHPQVAKILEETRKAYPYSFISILTNGLALPTMKEEFWQSLKENNIVIELSKYPVMNNKFIDILDLIDDKEAQLGVMFLRKKFYDNFNEDGNSDMNTAHKNCGCRKGTTLWKQHIYPCAACYREYYNKIYNKEIVIPKGYNIYKSSFDEILKNIYVPTEACKYCKEIPLAQNWKQYNGQKYTV